MSSSSPSSRSLTHYDVVIVGGGFSGSILAAQLLRKTQGAISLAVVERSPRRSRGVAYSTRVEAHLLNVPAGKMSAFPDDAEHFLRWAQKHYDADVEGGSFVPRRVYGEYIEATLREAQGASNGRLEWIHDEVVAVTRKGNEAELSLADGRKLIADRVVLALGNFRPSDPSLPGKSENSTRYIPFAWDESAISEAAPKGDVLLVGSGLTCVDVAIMLRSHRFAGAIHVLSRRGLLPRRHRATKPWPGFWNARSPRTVLGLLRLIRQQVRMAHKQGVDWRAVVDSLRPFTAEIWASLPMAEKRRFLRHARPYWEVHRHRVAPEIGDFLGGQIADHDIQAHAGRITRYDEKDDCVEVTYHDRLSGREAKVRVGFVVNCTGPENDARRLNHPLLNQLFAQGFARHDDLYLGLDVATDGALIEASGLKSEFLYTVGPTRKGSLWETTAVPEIRGQVAKLADDLLGELETEDRVSQVDDSATQTV